MGSTFAPTARSGTQRASHSKLVAQRRPKGHTYANTHTQTQTYTGTQLHTSRHQSTTSIGVVSKVASGNNNSNNNNNNYYYNQNNRRIAFRSISFVCGNCWTKRGSPHARHGRNQNIFCLAMHSSIGTRLEAAERALACGQDIRHCHLAFGIWHLEFGVWHGPILTCACAKRNEKQRT